MLIGFFWFGIVFLLIYTLMIIKKIKQKQTGKHCVLFSLVYLYIIMLIKIVFFPIPFNMVMYDLKYNFIPFSGLIASNHISLEAYLRNMIGNIVLFLPIGYYLPFAYKKFQSIRRILMASFLVSLSIEAIQFFIGIMISHRYRVVDIDDIIFNVMGAVIGFFIYKLFKKKWRNL